MAVAIPLPARSHAAYDRVWAAPVLLAGAIACATARSVPVVVAAVLVALVPWSLGILGRPLPLPVFGALAILPVAAILAVQGLSAAMFLATTALCLLASRATGRGWIVLIAAVGVALPFVSHLDGLAPDPGALYFAIGDLFGVAVGLLIARTRRLDAELRAADARLAAVAAQEERTRLARDVHDLVAHSLTVVVLQVGGARRILRNDPAAAEAALQQAERVCRESLDGIREVVGLLRSPDGDGASLDLVRLAETYRAAAVPVELEVEGEPDALPLLVRGTLYRVVQEALANAARYRAPDSAVRVVVRADGDGAAVQVTNASGGARRTGPGGYGLTGLREQVAAIGGELRSGPVRDGWSVACRLPVTASAARVEVAGR